MVVKIMVLFQVDATTTASRNTRLTLSSMCSGGVWNAVITVVGDDGEFTPTVLHSPRFRGWSRSSGRELQAASRTVASEHGELLGGCSSAASIAFERFFATKKPLALISYRHDDLLCCSGVSSVAHCPFLENQHFIVKSGRQRNNAQ